MKVNKETIIRTVVLLVALVNSILTSLGKNPIPFSDEEIYEGLSAFVMIAATVWAWWKNNSFTNNAIKADEYKALLDEGEKE